MKIFVFLILALGFSSKSIGQSTTKEPKHAIDFTGLTFLSSACNGTCPGILMNLYDDQRIEISRAIYNKKGQIDTILSGNFKGTLSNKEFNKVVSLWKKVNWDTVTFPKILCCDGPIVTLMFSYQGTYKRFKSMAPPRSAHALIDYLTYLGSKVLIPRYDKPIDFEDFEL